MLVAVAAAHETTVTQLATIVGLERTILTKGLRILERQRLVGTTAGKDTKSRRIRLTPSGETLLVKALPLWKKAQATVRKIGDYEVVMQAFRDINKKELI